MQGSVSTSGELVLELFDTAGGIDVLEFSCEERVAFATNVHLQLFANAPSCKRVTATASNRCFHVFGVNISFHNTRRRNYFAL